MSTDPKGAPDGAPANQQEPAAAPASELAQAIQRLHAEMKGRQRQVAQFALENLHELAFLPASAVAKRAGVHSATVVRFAQRLGFDGYPAMQQHLRHHLPQYPAFLELMGRADTTSPILDQCFAQGRRNLEQAARTVDPTAFEGALTALIRCRRVLVIGLGVARPVALYLESSLRITGLDVHDAADSVSLAQEIALLGGDDVVFAIDFHRYYRETATATRAAREIGATVVALTDSAISPLAEHAHHTLHVPSEGAAPRTSLVPAMALLEGLLATITVRARDRAESAMDLVDRQYRSAGLFVGS